MNFSFSEYQQLFSNHFYKSVLSPHPFIVSMLKDAKKKFGALITVSSKYSN